MSISSYSVTERNAGSLGTRVSWGAIFAGTVLALAFCLLFTTLSGAVGLSLHERNPSAGIHAATIIWAIIILCVAVFVGGMTTSLLTLGENKTEAVVHGLLMWALLVGILAILGANGVRIGIIHTTPSQAAMSERPADGAAAIDRAEGSDTAKRIAWYAFAATWLSMIAGATGAYLGAGPTFRIRTVTATTQVHPA
jgi:hypothetical protein